MSAKSIYVDTVVGPLASLIFSLHQTSGNKTVKDSIYKEICDLIELSMKKRWW